MKPEQLPLFDSPASPVRRTFPAPRSSTIRYTRIATKAGGRTLCDDCCRLIHELGQLLAPLPRRAVWRRTDDKTAVVLCQAHKDERHAHDAT